MENHCGHYRTITLFFYLGGLLFFTELERKGQIEQEFRTSLEMIVGVLILREEIFV